MSLSASSSARREADDDRRPGQRQRHARNTAAAPRPERARHVDQIRGLHQEHRARREVDVGIQHEAEQQRCSRSSSGCPAAGNRAGCRCRAARAERLHRTHRMQDVEIGVGDDVGGNGERQQERPVEHPPPGEVVGGDQPGRAGADARRSSADAGQQDAACRARPPAARTRSGAARVRRSPASAANASATSGASTSSADGRPEAGEPGPGPARLGRLAVNVDHSVEVRPCRPACSPPRDGGRCRPAAVGSTLSVPRARDDSDAPCAPAFTGYS